MQNVKLLVLDIDGTLTDGTLLYTDDGTHAKAFHVADGLGIVMAQAAGLRVAVISGRAGPSRGKTHGGTQSHRCRSELRR